MATPTPITQDEALAMLAECFMEPPENLAPGTLREAIAGWDSMGALMFMAELDERFGLELTAEQSKAMTSVADALAYLRAHGALQPA
jgi:acyl carrier protein